MDISKKIEEIRQKPEHIRLRYVWGAVAISMIFVVIIWIFSISESAKKMFPVHSNTAVPTIKQSIEDMKTIGDSASSINEALKAMEAENQNQGSSGEETTTDISPNGESEISGENTSSSSSQNPLIPKQ